MGDLHSTVSDFSTQCMRYLKSHDYAVDQLRTELSKIEARFANTVGPVEVRALLPKAVAQLLACAPYSELSYDNILTGHDARYCLPVLAKTCAT